jgi:hypothetical protein
MYLHTTLKAFLLIISFALATELEKEHVGFSPDAVQREQVRD